MSQAKLQQISHDFMQKGGHWSPQKQNLDQASRDINSNVPQFKSQMIRSQFQTSQPSGIKFNLGPIPNSQNLNQINKSTAISQNCQFKKIKDIENQSSQNSASKMVTLNDGLNYEKCKALFPNLNEAEIHKMLEDENVSGSNSSQETSTKFSERNERMINLNKKVTTLKLKDQIKQFHENQAKTYESNHGKSSLTKNKQPRANKKRNRRAVDQPQQENLVRADEIQDNHQMETQERSEAQILQPVQNEVQQSNLSPPPQDQFFFTLENNFNNVMGNRDAAYSFITQLLEQYKANVDKSENKQDAPTELMNKIQKMQKESIILKKGIQIQNKKLNENSQKVLQYDQMMVIHQQSQFELNNAKNMIQFLLKSQIQDPHIGQLPKNNNFSDHMGGGGGGVF